jgi:3-oxo-4,17-pregnadiene-20-carboxyl-CoA hydratase alpha subunit
VTERVITLKGFFEEAREGRLSAIRCGSCGELAIPPKELCPSCHERRWELVPLHGTGSVASFTVIRIPPRGRLPEAPYAVAVVKLDEGVSLLGRIVDIPLDALTAGLSVRFRPLLLDDQVIISFGPA